MNKLFVSCLAAALLAGAGCKDKPKEIPAAVLAEAAQHSSEAEFATQIRDYPRAKGLLEQAVKLDPEAPRYWMQLGAVQKRMGNASDARKAYEKARTLVQAEYKRDQSTAAPLLAEVELCILLGKPDEARKVLARAQKEHKDDREVRLFTEGNVLDNMLASREVKEVGL